MQRVVSLAQRRLMDPAAVIAGLPHDTRPLPSVNAYDELLAKRSDHLSGWTKTFTDPRLGAATVDRLTFNGTIIETGADFYRVAHTIAQQAAS